MWPSFLSAFSLAHPFENHKHSRLFSLACPHEIAALFSSVACRCTSSPPHFPLSPPVSAPSVAFPSSIAVAFPPLSPLLVSMAKKGASSSNPTATWNAHNISIFCDVCIKEIEGGHCPGTHYDKDVYANIRANFKAETWHDYQRKQLKNKWDALKNEWKLWKELVGKETGLGWNSSKGTVDAFDEWWNNKIQINKEYARLRKKKISPEMEDKLDRMFSNTVATGEHAWAPSSGVLPPEPGEESVGQIDSDDEEEIETMQDLRQASRKGKKRAANLGELRKNTAKLCGQIDRLVEAYETRSSANSLMRSLHIGSSISEVLAAVTKLPGCEPPSELWMFATCLFCSAEKREVFTTMQDPEVQLAWLKYMFNREQ